MYEKLLVAVDHSESTGRVIDAARELALLAHSEVWVLHLRELHVPGKVPVGPGLADDETTAEAQATVDTMVGDLAGAGRGRSPGSILGARHDRVRLAGGPGSPGAAGPGADAVSPAS
jgi:nucleotide-binding universal stress UspA family protein